MKDTKMFGQQALVVPLDSVQTVLRVARSRSLHNPLTEEEKEAIGIVGVCISQALSMMQPSPLEREVAEAMKRFNALSPEEKAIMHKLQRRNWVVSELLNAHPEMQREEALRIYDRIAP